MKNRKRNRKKGFDYSSENIYFVTINTHNHTHDFGSIFEKQMTLNEYGKIVENQIYWLQEQYLYVNIYNAVVMPNHLHILLDIDTLKIQDGTKIKSVSELMGAFKTTSSKQIHLSGNTEFQWHRSFHDHIVCDAKEYENIYNYISDNPARWDKDIHNNA